MKRIASIAVLLLSLASPLWAAWTASLPGMVDDAVPGDGTGTPLNKEELDTKRFQKLIGNDLYLLDVANSIGGVLSSTDPGEGASRIGVEDSANHFTSSNVEGVLGEVGATFDTLDARTGSGAGIPAANVLSEGTSTLADLFDGGYDITLRPGDVITKGPWVDVRAYGAIADDGLDDAAAIQAAINAAQSAGRPVFLPSGTWRIDSSLTHTVSTVGRSTQGLRLIGAGMTKTIIDSRVASGAAIKLTTDTKLAYTQGAVISDLTITSTVPAASSSGISLAAQWDITIERVWITGLTGDAITFPLMTSLSSQPDEYQCLYPTIQHCELTYCNGWGVNGAAGNAVAGLRVRECLIAENKLGGAFVAGQMASLTGNAFQFNGETSGGGIRVGYVHATPNGVIIDGNEFDSNHDFNVWMEATSGGSLSRNKFISKERSSALWPPLHVKFGVSGAGTAATSITAYGNHHRRDAAAYDITCYKWESASGLRADVLNPTYNLGSGVGTITKYSGAAGTGSEVIESGATVTPREQPTVTLNRIVTTPQNIPTSLGLITFTSIPGHSTGFSSGVFTAPSDGYYLVNYALTLTSAVAGDTITLQLISDTSTDRGKQYFRAGGLTDERFGFSRTLYMTSGMTLKPYGSISGATPRAILLGEPYNWFEVTKL